jgi:hypothetical protein
MDMETFTLGCPKIRLLKNYELLSGGSVLAARLYSVRDTAVLQTVGLFAFTNHAWIVCRIHLLSLGSPTKFLVCLRTRYA